MAVTVERVGFGLRIADAADDPVYQSFILKELSRFENVNATFVDGVLYVSIGLGGQLSKKGLADHVATLYERILKLVSLAKKKYDKYRELRDILDTPAYTVRDVLPEIPALEA